MNVKAWFDQKDDLMIKSGFGAPGGPLTFMADIRSISFAPPLRLFSPCPRAAPASSPHPHPPNLIAYETGDNGDNWVNAIYGPGSKTSCSILVHVVAAKTMAPSLDTLQAAIDTTYNRTAPPHPATPSASAATAPRPISGGGLHEITNQVKNYTLRIDTPPAYFNFGVNIPTPGSAPASVSSTASASPP